MTATIDSAAHVLKQCAHDRLEAIKRLAFVETVSGKVVALGKAETVAPDAAGSVTRGLRPEQVEVIRALETHQNVLVLKARQLGVTTVVLAWLFLQALFSRDAYNVLSLAHDEEGMRRMNSMLSLFLEQLLKLGFPIPTGDWNTELVTVGRSALRQRMAGSRGQGRGFTFQALHATEVGFWPRGSSATGKKATDAHGADDDAWAAVNSTIHEQEHVRVVVESTAESPVGVFHRLVKTARTSDEWKFLFFAWFTYPAYRRKLPMGWEATDDETELAELYGLDEEQLAWRRYMIIDKGFGLERFRREYPTTWEEPFLLAEGMWHNTENLNRMLAGIPTTALNQKDGLRVYMQPEPGRMYYIGADPSGGVGRDEAAFVVLRDDWSTVAVFSHSRVGPLQFANVVAEVAALYNRARVLTEKNNYGAAVLKRLRDLGANLWVDLSGKDWWTDTQNKLQLASFCREQVDDGYVELLDPLLISQMMTIREQRVGVVGADPGSHDDLWWCLCLALWNARLAVAKGVSIPVRQRVAKLAQRRREFA